MKKILIVEDDYYIRDIYERYFRSAEFEVITASDGETALEEAQKTAFDVILLDIMLPKVTGLEVLRSLRHKISNTKDTPIFMITNLGHENIIKETFKIGADGYFIKAQMNPDDLVNEIKNFFNNEIIHAQQISDGQQNTN